MKIILLKDHSDANGRLFKSGTELDIAIRSARSLILKGVAKEKDIAQRGKALAYSKDNPPPEIEEVELPDEGIFSTPEEDFEQKNISKQPEKELDRSSNFWKIFN